MSTGSSVNAVAWCEGKLRLLDQRRLPNEVVYIDYDDPKAVAGAIRDLVVRGAPAIGITAAYAVVLAVKKQIEAGVGDWRSAITGDLETLAASRPTAVNLFWALDKMQRRIEAGVEEPVADLLAEARLIQFEDIAANKRMGQLGADLIDGPCGVLTHCNAGALATGGYGTALGVIRSAHAQGRLTQVYADETRPVLQGGRLTAWELLQDQIPVTLIPDGAAAALMASGRVKWLIVGSDRIAANGDVANKIGTYSAAVNAQRHGVKVMVVAPTSTVDMACPSGAEIPIEERDGAEVMGYGQETWGAPGAQVWNPAFDVTPAELVDALVTERGVLERPSAESMAEMMGL